MKRKSLIAATMAVLIAFGNTTYASDLDYAENTFSTEALSEESSETTEETEYSEETVCTEDAAYTEDTEDTEYTEDADNTEELEDTESQAAQYTVDDTEASTETVEEQISDNTEAVTEVQSEAQPETQSETESVPDDTEYPEAGTSKDTETAEDETLHYEVAEQTLLSSSTDTIYIGTEAELFAMADNPLSNFELTADITITEDLTDFIVEYFEGTLNGNGHTITYHSSCSKSLFSVMTETAEVKNLSVYAEITDTMDNAAMIAAVSSGKITNCVTNGSVTTESCGNGFVVINAGTISGCTNNAEIVLPFSASLGGGVAAMATTNSGAIINCINNGTVTGESASGIACINSGTIINCTNYGDISGKIQCGGITAHNTSHAQVDICENYGKVSATGNSETGGIVGICDAYGTVTNCINYGDVSGTGYIGGICGSVAITSGTSFDENDNLIVNPGAVTISNCKNHGSLLYNSTAATNSTYMGGIVGHVHTLNGPVSINDCTNFGSIVGTTDEDRINAGGITALIVSNRSGSFYCENLMNYGNVSSCKYAAGIACTLQIGNTQNVIVKNCINSGAINAEYSSGIGNSSEGTVTLDQCLNIGSIYGSDVAYGIGKSNKITNCYNLGTVEAGRGNACGIGWADSISLSYNAGAVICQKAGSIAVTEDWMSIYKDSTVTNCYYLETGTTEAFGTSLTVAQMQSKGSFSGFDFDAVWTMKQQAGMLLPALSGLDISFMDNVPSVGNCGVALSGTSFSYTGKEIVPGITVTYGQKTLANGSDYTVSFRNNVNAGTATAVILGKGAYIGSKTINFTISPASLGSAKIAKISDLTYSGKAQTPSVTVTYGSATLVKDTDYTVSYSNNTNAGTASVKISGKGNYSGSISANFKILKASLNGATVSKISDQTYSGKAKKPSVTVKCGSKTLKKDTDYTVSYSNNTNAGTASVKISGKGNYSGSISANFKITKKSLKDATISKISDQYYTGKALKPSVTVKCGSTTLKKDTDYTVSYSDNKKTGTATVTVKGKGNYSGSTTAKFKIVNKVSSVKAASSGYNSIKVSWSKIDKVTGYKIYRSEKKDGKYKCIKTISDSSTTTYTDKKLTCGKTYYYKVTPYKSSTAGKSSKVVSSKPVPSKPGNLTVKSTSTKKTSLSWDKVSGASGYEIYQATSKDGTYKKIKTINKGSTVSYTASKLTRGKTYYYKVRAYRTVNDKKIYSSYSSIKSVKVK